MADPRRLLPALMLALGLGASPVEAGDFYVDALQGSDVTGSGSAAFPWRTIGHALAQGPVGGDTIHVGPGVYDAALGETFGYAVPLGVALRGAGPGQTVLDGGGAPVLFSIDGDPLDATPPPSLVGMRLIGATNGVFLGPDPASGIGFARLDDLWLDGLTNAGISCGAGPGETGGFELNDLRVTGCGVGVSCFATDGGASLHLRASRIEDCGVGVELCGFGPALGGGFATGLVEGCELRRCGTGVAVMDAGGGYASVDLESTLVADGTVGVLGEDVADVRVWRSTVTGNVNGIVAGGDVPSLVLLYLGSANVWGNTTQDLDPSFVASAIYSNTGVPLPPPNYSVDPLFVDPASGDYHLQAGSPLVDAGNPDATKLGTDGDMDPRILDGDLDGAARIDVGHDESNPTRLSLSGGLVPGQTTTLSTTGPPGASYCVGWALAPDDVDLGPLGNLLLDPTTLVVVSCGALPGSDPLPVPPNPALSGLAVELQGLAFSALPVGPGSFSNRVSAVVQ